MLRYINNNDNLRAVIRYANKKKRNGELVLVAISGDLVDYFQDRTPKFDDSSASNIALVPNVDNYTILHELLTGRDGRGEALECPVFTILGNHDFLEREPPMSLDVTIDIFFGKVHLTTKDSWSNFGLTAQEGSEYDFWAESCPPLLGAPNAGGPRGCRDAIKAGDYRYHIDMSRSSAYNLLKSRNDLLGSYLRQINFDTDYSQPLGPHHMLFLNTAEDIMPSQGWIEDRIKGDAISGFYTEVNPANGDPFFDMISDGTHCRGISEQHLDLLRTALRKSQDPTILFCFTHSPLLNLQGHWTEGRELLYELNHKSMTPPPPPNRISMLLYCMLKDIPFTDKTADSLEEFKRKMLLLQLRKNTGWYEDIEIFTARLKSDGFLQGNVPYIRLGAGRSLWVSAGCTDELGRYRPPYPSSLPPGKKSEDIVGFAIAGSDDHNYVWFKDGTCCSGTSDDLDRYRAPYHYTLPPGERPEDIVGMAMAGSDDHTYVWFKDGTCCSGTSDDLDCYRSPYRYSLPLNKKPADIAGIAIAKSDDHTYVWFKDGTCCSGTSDHLDCHRPLYNSSLPAGLRVRFTDIIDMDMASDDHTYVWYLVPPR
jgi:uncharacterized membrane protein